MLGRRRQEKREEKARAEAQALATLERLTALSPDGLAAEVLPALAAEAAKHPSGHVQLVAVRAAMLDGHIGFHASAEVNRIAIGLPMREAAQRLEHANLIVLAGTAAAAGQSDYRITAEGKKALAEGTVAEILARSSGSG